MHAVPFHMAVSPLADIRVVLDAFPDTESVLEA